MAIPDEEVARVRAATDLVALISEHSALKRQGRRWVGLCPFHQERSPSFSVNAEEGFYYCFGCQKSGDAITFVREIERVDFVDAVRRLADKVGITITEDAAVTAERQRRSPLYQVVEKAVDWYHERLLSAPDAGRARDYLRSRGYDSAVVRQFRLGWAPDEWDSLARALSVSGDVLEASGLGFVNKAGRRQDSFRARVIFPICDPSGRPIALGGRILPPTAGRDGSGKSPVGPKYKNSQEGPIYSKRRTLYGLNWAKYGIIESDEVVVCEGYTDVIGCFVAGIPRAVATCGTALGEEHFKLLSNFAHRIVLAYDSDAAGQSGAGRVYEWERHHQVDVAVADLPSGSDPGQLAREQPETLRQALRDAKPYLAFRVERALGSGNLATPESRAKTAEAAVAAVAEHPNPLVRDPYLMEIADRCRVDPAGLRSMAGQMIAEGAASGSGGSNAGSGASNTGLDASNTGRARAPRTEARNGFTRTEAGVEVPLSEEPPAGDWDGRHHDGYQDDFGGRPSRSDAAGRGGEMGADGRDAAESRRSGGRSDRQPGQHSPGWLAGLEALRFAVHNPELVSDRLEAVLFADWRQRAAFEALIESQDLQHAIATAEEQNPDIADLLRRVAVEEPAGDADNQRAEFAADVCKLLLRLATRKALADVQARARMQWDSPEVAAASKELQDDLQALEAIPAGDGGAGTSEEVTARSSAAAQRLLAWLMGRAEESL